MGRFSGSNSGSFWCTPMTSTGTTFWRMGWRVDYYYPDSNLRYPRGFSRDTEDEKAARRFCKKHNIEFKEK